jgi:serine/threonine protein kinase
MSLANSMGTAICAIDATKAQFKMLVQNKVNLTGQNIGNYQLEKLLISRKVSDLYLASDVKLDQRVLLEVLTRTTEEEPDLAARFERRMESVLQLKHPNIAAVSEISVTADGYPYAVMEYIQGITLEEQLAEWQRDNTTLPVTEALTWTRQLADALSVAHPAGLIHHDLRPKNILLREDKTPVLVDLGVPIAMEPRDAVLSNSHPDTLDYASPEELEGKAISRRSNIYSLGIILYELLTNHRPKLPTSSWDIFERATMPKEVPLEEAREGLSGETYRLVRNCLWRQEWSRFETADELVTAIDTAILAEQVAPKAAIWSDSQRNWRYIAAPLVAVLLVVIGIFIFAALANSNGSTTTPEATAVATDPAAGLADSPTAEPTATPTKEALPTSAAEIKVDLFEPVADATFTQRDRIRFAWLWLLVVAENEQFRLYLSPETVDASPEILLGSVSEPNTANLYLLPQTISELGVVPGTYTWQVRLEDQATGEVLAESDPRRLTILADTPTPTLTPTPEVSSTPTVTFTPTAEACVPERPPGWLVHTVRPGDTISTFAQRANVTVNTILQANCLPPGTVLSVGQTLFIPPPLATRTPTPGAIIPSPAPPGPGPITPPTAVPTVVVPTADPTAPPIPTVPGGGG